MYNGPTERAVDKPPPISRCSATKEAANVGPTTSGRIILIQLYRNNEELLILPSHHHES